MPRRGRWVAVGLLAATLTMLAAAAPSGAGTASVDSDGVFTVMTNSYAFGQAPIWMPGGHIVFFQNFRQGAGTQIYTANMDGSHRVCLTCGQKSPNATPQLRPGGGWMVYHSWQGHTLTLGMPGMGGLGSELWIMRTDGSDRTQLTGQNPNPGFGSGEAQDDYHAYWSPDGKQIVWAHLNWNFVDNNGNGQWDIRVADVTTDGPGAPHLANERVVHPADGHWMETQWWAPDGSGFLYTESWGTTMNTELFFCRLTPTGCESTRLTDDPGWDEQALFTPDMQDVIFMSSRDHPGLYNSASSLAQDLQLTTAADYILALPVFEAGFEQPLAPEATDLYELHLATGAVRRLTHDGDDHWIIPEFSWDPSHTVLFWTELRFHPGARVSLPLDPGSQLADEVDLLLHPPPLPIDTNNPLGNLLQPQLPIDSRTRVGTFALG